MPICISSYFIQGYELIMVGKFTVPTMLLSEDRDYDAHGWTK